MDAIINLPLCVASGWQVLGKDVHQLAPALLPILSTLMLDLHSATPVLCVLC
jgi:hypothetical protein